MATVNDVIEILKQELQKHRATVRAASTYCRNLEELAREAEHQEEETLLWLAQEGVWG